MHLVQVEIVLVINKVDRLITELRLSPMEAYARLQRIIREVNYITSALQSERYLSQADALLAYEEAKETLELNSGG